MTKFLTYYIISGAFALFIITINTYILYQAINYHIYDSGIFIRKVLLIILSSYVIIFNEISRRTNRWHIVIDLIKRKSNIKVKKIDFFITFSFSLSFYYFTFIFLVSLFYIINEYVHLPAYADYLFFTLIKYFISIISVIPLFIIIKKYRQQSQFVNDNIDKQLK